MTASTHADPCFDPALNLARQSLYRVAALSLLDPRAGAWERLNALRGDPVLDQAEKILRNEPAAIARALAPGERPLARLDASAALARLPASAAELNEQYERTFGLLVSKACPPYETEYIPEKFTFQRSQALADIAGFYAAFGLEPSSAHPERHDHIVLELEFMALLLDMERRAIQHDLPNGCDKAVVCHDAQSRFLKEHLAWWAPAFCKLLARESSGGFYEGVALLLAAFVPAERSLLGIEAATRTVSPSAAERPDECEGCMLARS